MAITIEFVSHTAYDTLASGDDFDIPMPSVPIPTYSNTHQHVVYMLIAGRNSGWSFDNEIYWTTLYNLYGTSPVDSGAFRAYQIGGASPLLGSTLHFHRTYANNSGAADPSISADGLSVRVLIYKISMNPDSQPHLTNRIFTYNTIVDSFAAVGLTVPTGTNTVDFDSPPRVVDLNRSVVGNVQTTQYGMMMMAVGAAPDFQLDRIPRGVPGFIGIYWDTVGQSLSSPIVSVPSPIGGATAITAEVVDDTSPYAIDVFDSLSGGTSVAPASLEKQHHIHIVLPTNQFSGITVGPEPPAGTAVLMDQQYTSFMLTFFLVVTEWVTTIGSKRVPPLRQRQRDDAYGVRQALGAQSGAPTSMQQSVRNYPSPNTYA